jgi:hypothetical protein
MTDPTFNHIKFGDGLTVVDEGGGVIRVDAGGGGTGGGIDFNKANDADASGAIADYLDISVVGTGVSGESVGGRPSAIKIAGNGDAGGIGLQNNNDDGITLRDTGSGGFDFVATGSGNGFAAGRINLECNGGQTTIKNTDEGIVLYSTGNFSDGRITDLAASAGLGSTPGIIIAASDGIIISQSAFGNANDEFNDIGPVFLVMDTGDAGLTLLRSPVLNDTTSDPGVPSALWNDGGTVVLSGFTAGGGGGIQFDASNTGEWLEILGTGPVTVAGISLTLLGGSSGLYLSDSAADAGSGNALQWNTDLGDHHQRLKLWLGTDGAYEHLWDQNGTYSCPRGIAAFGHTPPSSQPATPTTLAHVISILQGAGLCA